MNVHKIYQHHQIHIIKYTLMLENPLKYSIRTLSVDSGSPSDKADSHFLIVMYTDTLQELYTSSSFRLRFAKKLATLAPFTNVTSQTQPKLATNLGTQNAFLSHLYSIGLALLGQMLLIDFV